ncbi:MAG: hypothetical protein LBE86_04270 [Gemmobacter sp.]|jgi:Ca2+-binding RTX toxin-like protein|nr:hypothetical protein [Gemmobacter sp.]
MRFDVLGTFSAAASQMIAGVTDICVRMVGGAARVYTTTRPGGGMLALELTETGTGLRLIDQQDLKATWHLAIAPTLTLMPLDRGETLVWTGGLGTRTGTWLLDGAGGIDRWLGMEGGPAGIQSAHHFLRVGGRDLAVMAGYSDGALTVWSFDPVGRLAQLNEVQLSLPGQMVEILALASVRVEGQSFLLSLSTAEDGLTVWRIRADGSLTVASRIGASGGMGIADPAALAVVEAGGTPWVFVAATGSSSLSVLRIDGAGTAVLTDHVIDTLDTRFQSVQALTTAVIGDRVFLFAGGADEGLTAFVLMPDGRLTAAGQILRGDGLALDNITAIEAVVLDGRIELIVAGEGSGLHRIRVDPGALAPAILGTAGADRLIGSAQGDMISGGAGNDTIDGGEGDDYILDGTGEDELRGGPGADVFVMAADGNLDIIRDVALGEDRIDLSGWGRVYSVQVLPMAGRRGCVVIRWGNEALYVYSHDGKDIDPKIFASSDFFGLWHVVGPVATAGQLLAGIAGAETVTGGTGDDTLLASGGGDLLSGGMGVDIVDYGEAPAGVLANLAAPGSNRGLAAGDRYVGIEGLAGSTFNDTLIGDAGANRIEGRAGSDLLSGGGGGDLLDGGAGDDTLIGGAGPDTLVGGSGRDLASYAGAGGGVTVDMMSPGMNTGAAAGDLLRGIEDLSGTPWRDTLFGDEQDNMLYGLGKADRLWGRDGNDTLRGGAGRDSLFGDAGNDLLDGGKGQDWVIYEGRIAVRIDLAITDWQDTGGYGFDQLIGIEHVRGSWRDDTLAGDGHANRILADGGNDWLDGRGGNDWLESGVGDDTIIGGTGFDRAVYRGNVAVRVDLALQVAQETGLGRDLLVGIEAVIGGDGGDRLRGDAQANLLVGEGGADLLIGRDGNDTLRGGAGNDTLVGGVGRDRLEGGPGIDIAAYEGYKAMVLTLAQNGRTVLGGDGDILSGIEGLRSGSGNDRLTGNSQANRLEGGRGADLLIGRAGDDTLVGGKGNDSLIGGEGNDLFLGGPGTDWAIYEGQVAVKVSLALSGPQVTGQGTDTLIGIEALQGGAGHDQLTGNGGANWLAGGAGNDLLIGGAGRDWLSGGPGNDILIGGSGADRFVFEGGQDRIRDFNRAEDRLLLDTDLLGLPPGLSAQGVVDRWGEDLGDSVALDFGKVGRIVLEHVPTLTGLAQVIELI